MEIDIHQKIKGIVVAILENADMNVITEFKVREMASKHLGIDLSDIELMRFIRGVVESYLISTADQDTGDQDMDGEGKEGTDKTMMQELDIIGNRSVHQLSNKRFVVIEDFQGRCMVSIRDVYEKDERQLSSNKGISLTAGQWSVLKTSVPAIDDAISKLLSKLRSDHDGTQNQQPKSPELIPMDIIRMDGKNYQSWAPEIERILKQLGITYVLSEPSPEPISSARHKWSNDDRVCRHSILNSLSDSLYYKYSKATMGAKQLWEELKSVYLHDDEFGKRRYQVKRYINFTMNEASPILEQVKQLNNIADAVIGAGIFFDETFHVSSILSKLPPSWKDFCIKFMSVEYLPFSHFMNYIKLEEEARMMDVQKYISNGQHAVGPTSWDLKTQRMCWERGEIKVYGGQFACFFCGKRGHISKKCPCRSQRMNHFGCNTFK